MDRKRELTSVDCAALAGELRAFVGAYHEKSYLYDDDLLRLKLSGPNFGRIELLIEVDDPKRVHTVAPERVPDAPERPPNFAMMLRNRLEGAQLASVEQFEFDRILQLRFERSDDHTTIIAELFGDGNLAVLDETDTVIDSLETVRLQSRTVTPGSRYEFPSARFNPLTVEYETFVERMRQSDADVVRTLATQLNFGGLYGEELCSRAGVSYNQAIEETTDVEFEALYDAVSDLSERLREGDLDPRLYVEADDQETPVDVTPVPLVEYEDKPSEAFDSFNDALEEYFLGLEQEPDEEETGSNRPGFEAEIEKQKRIIAQQEGAIEDFEEEAAAEREKAELLYANYDLVDEVLSTIQDARAADTPWAEIEETLSAGKDQGIPAAEAVSDVDGSEGTVTVQIDDHRIELDADTGVEKNADRLYQEAKRIEDKKAGAKEAIENTREQLEAVKQRREAWEASDGNDGGDGSGDTDEDDQEDIDWLARESIPIRTSEEWYEHFRWFHTSDGFLVIGGRNADQNEELVKKYLDRGDLFFHTQAHGAPATILKATGPSEAPPDDISIPESSREEAAQFAISYSTLWKDGKYAGDVYCVEHDQVTKTPESGEYLEKGSFAIRGERTYYDDTPVGVAVGITCEPETRVIGGPPSAISGQAETAIEVEPGRYAQNDIAKRLYREFKGRFADDTFVRKVASPDLIQEFLPAGGSRMVGE
ncbi:Fibronectin-binding A domain protein [Halorhabdus tiamatea SARL4B]|uniref:Archaeal Rqc2 homolog aRqcH n=1 Tax=Halorhabdus tiamatea SARL4B TaxID=1033806 RepID=F7PPI4_9EURY|nr:ribosome rescue protein RqcH [Halorhabdus tiamatea]ERJ04656.1 Fibronectin-binding A domain protein [Halorhabdus tiamatea SARL4B]CCQ34683.1 fibronectin-binding A domain-containing protein [Halorhabdus tiamatea SARL4B]